MKFVRLPVVAVTLAGALAAAPAAVAAAHPPGPAVIIGYGHGLNPARAADLPVSDGSSTVIEPDHTTTTFTNWAGWGDLADTNVELRYVTANFVVPTVSCPGRGFAASFWVGLDGDQEGGTVEQTGVEVVCNIALPSGGYAPTYFSFWEMFPNGVHVQNDVSPGDQIAVSVYYNSSTGEYNLALSDGSATSADINTYQFCPSGYTCHNKTAEVIAEDPGGGPSKGAYLAKFSRVTFTSIGVTSRNGTKGTLEGNSLWSSNEALMAYQGHPMATPSSRNDGYTSFYVDWNGSG